MSHSCAQDNNGELLDAAKIPWYNDPDDDEPMLPSSAMATNGSSVPPSHRSSVTVLDRQLSATTLERFFKDATPVEKIAGSCRSACIPHPSMKATDPKNAMALKRKKSLGADQPHRNCHIVPDSDDGQSAKEEDAKMEPDEAKTEYVDSGAEDDLNGEYKYTKALGDVDREV